MNDITTPTPEDKASDRALLARAYNDASSFQVIAEELSLAIMDVLGYENPTCRLLTRAPEPWLRFRDQAAISAACTLEAGTLTALSNAQDELLFDLSRMLSLELLRLLELQAEPGELSEDAASFLVHPDMLPAVNNRVTDKALLAAGYVGYLGKKMTWVHTIAVSRAVPPTWKPTAAYALPSSGVLGRIWLGKPQNGDDWPGCLEGARRAAGELVALITSQANAYVLVPDEDEAAHPERWLPLDRIRRDRLHLLVQPTDRCWLRDTAPLPVPGPEGPAALDWAFNGWARYEDHKLDAEVGAFLCAQHGFKRVPVVWKGAPVVMEGGAYDVNGRGSVLVTRECLLSAEQCRNPGFTEDDYVEIFAAYLRAPRVIWLEGGIAGDDTHGHVDGVARFVAPNRVLAAAPRDPADENHRVLAENLRILRAERDARGRRLEVVELPMPARREHEGEALPASYANFLILNDLVIVPAFDDPNDARARAIIEQATGRRAVGLDSRDLVVGQGTVHCLTHHIPAPGGRR